jgi:FixJ family two-component response regulator
MSQAIIYIIDDHEDGREGLQALLSVHGYQIESFADAAQFLEIKNRTEIGCVITDFRMDDIDGLELLTQLKKEKSLLPVILVSAYATVPEAVKIMQHGALTLIQKPYSEQQILEAVEKAMKINSQQSIQQGHQTEIQKQFNSLTGEELQILELLVSGTTSKMIALQLSISPRTIDRRKQAIFTKLKVDSIAELTMLYIEWSQMNEDSQQFRLN